MKKKSKKRQGPSSMPSDVLNRIWTPLVPYGTDPRSPNILVYTNSRYRVLVRRTRHKEGGPDVVHLSIKRWDQRPYIPYRDYMKIKDELCGPEYEGVWLLPARDREVDLSNQFHVWIINDPAYRFPFGFFDGRLVSDIALDGVVQDAWPVGERPTDCLPREQVAALMRGELGTLHGGDESPPLSAEEEG